MLTAVQGLFPFYEGGEAEQHHMVEEPNTMIGRKDYSLDFLPLKVKGRNQPANDRWKAGEKL